MRFKRMVTIVMEVMVVTMAMLEIVMVALAMMILIPT